MQAKPIQKELPPLIYAKDVVERKLRWLWWPYIPANSATLMFGPGGMGKSHITVEIASALSRGQPLPGQTFGPKPKQRVLMLSAEDEFDTVLVPRLRRAGADLEMIAFPETPFTLDKAGLGMLEQYIGMFDATLIIIDPIVHYMGGKVDMFRSNEVREIMGGIHQLAIRTQTTILVVGHTRKGGEGADYEKAMGSADFANAVRSGLFVTTTNDGTRVLRHAKSNYAPIGPSIPFTFGDGEDGHFAFGDPYEEDPTEIIGKAQKGPTNRQNIEVWLRDLLKNGPVPAKEVEQAAKDAKFGIRTIARVKDNVAESYAKREDGKIQWFWKLKEPKERKNVAKVSPVEGAERPSGPIEGPEVERGVETQSGSPAGGTDGPLGAGGLARQPVRPDADDPKAVAAAFLSALQAKGTA